VIQVPSDLQDEQVAVVLAGQLAKLESKEKPDRAANEAQQGPRVSRAQLAVKGAPGQSGTLELLARLDLRAQRVQWAPPVWSGLRASRAQLETLGRSGLGVLQVCKAPQDLLELQELQVSRANWATRGQWVPSELEVIRGNLVTQALQDLLVPKALQARRARRGQLVQEGRLELLVLEALLDP
jgi:hypothetical protein